MLQPDLGRGTSDAVALALCDRRNRAAEPVGVPFDGWPLSNSQVCGPCDRFDQCDHLVVDWLRRVEGHRALGSHRRCLGARRCRDRWMYRFNFCTGHHECADFASPHRRTARPRCSEEAPAPRRVATAGRPTFVGKHSTSTRLGRRRPGDCDRRLRSAEHKGRRGGQCQLRRLSSR